MKNPAIPRKPETVTWTDEQWKAIWVKGQDILVAAAAGSGKTAVLVERIINKILSAEDPVNVDELLVVTFTNLSAAEMRHRIGEALEEAIALNPASVHLRKQLSLLNRASISTLHSFCLEVIQKYYYKIDIDPGFRIADETEAQLLRDEVLEELFEEEYGNPENEAFYKLVDTFSNDRSDTALQDIVQKLYDFARSNPSPRTFLQSIIDMYKIRETAKMEELPFMRALLFEIELQLRGAKQLLQEALELTKMPGGPAPRAENFLDDLHIVDGLIQAKNDSWNTLYQAMQSLDFSRAKPCRGDEYDKDLVERSQKLREKAKKLLKKIQEEFFLRRPESFIRDMKEMAPHIERLVELVKEFSFRFDQIKKEKGIVDFGDLEHYCLQILGEEKEDGSFSPTEVGFYYQNHFKEVMVDEYQDTNMVQEAILQLVTKESESNGNLFMVGDVKQSIYRFRLAEPNLFLGKYNRFSNEGEEKGLRIDLSRNFRSRKEVLEGTNYLFKQIMGVNVGEINYDKQAELVKGATYPEKEKYPVEFLLIDQGEKDVKEELAEEELEAKFDLADLEQSRLEAKVLASKIERLIAERKPIYNAKLKQSRPIMYRDIVILLRSFTWVPQIIQEFKDRGIPVYADMSTGYFEATEISVMVSLLKIIDNPFQDIPLAAVLRSPVVGLNEEELAYIRIQDRKGTFYEAMSAFCQRSPEGEKEELFEKVKTFYGQLQIWRAMARQGSVSELIWQLYRDTSFYDFVGGMPGGKQRQANLRALYDRAKQYEETSFRGLFRFLRFIERMRERGNDLGAAHALGEQEDVVRIMTIHSSKGLEFPVVFVAGLSRQFNLLDLRKPYMFDKEFGFACQYVNAEKRLSHPSLPLQAFKRKKKLEMLAEEMRILYVALTRAKEKLFLVASVKDLQKRLEEWEQHLANREWLLPDYDRSQAKSYLDWIGPSLIRHHNGEPLRLTGNGSGSVPSEIKDHPSSWKIDIIQKEQILMEEEKDDSNENKDLLKKVYAGEPVPVQSEWKKMIENQLSWKYLYKDAANRRSKQSVSEMKRLHEIADEMSSDDLSQIIQQPLLRRPKFLQEKALSPAEKGTAMHMVMQLIDLSQPVSKMSVMNILDEMVRKEIMTTEQKNAIDIEQIVRFFATDLGKRIVSGKKVKRELPFSAAFSAQEVYPDWTGNVEPILVQGVIDCVLEEEGSLILLDYKTDAIHGRFKGGFEEAEPVLKKRYQVQIELYTKALERILKRKVTERYLYFFDGGYLLKL